MGVLPLLVACQRHSKSERFYLVADAVKHPYWQTAWAGFSHAADEYGVTVDMRGPDGFDPQAEVSAFREAVALKPSGILVQVGNEALMRPEIDTAVAAGIPVITIDSDAPASHRLYFIGTNNLQAGRLGGARVASQLKGKGNVVFFTVAGQPNLEERLKGYKDALAGYPEIKVVDVFDMKGDSGLAMDQTQQYLARTGAAKIDAVVCLESTSGKDVGEAFKRAGAGSAGTLLVAMDADEATLNLVKDGTIDSTIAQKPYTMGLLGLKALDDVYHYPVNPLAQDYALEPYAPYPAFIDTGVMLVDKSNVDTILKNVSGAGGN
jgi:ribose transport system substrate-binding protein